MTRWKRVLAPAAMLGGCEVAPPTPSDQIEVAWQFNLEFSLEQEAEDAYTARARLYDIAQAYDVFGNAGTIELTGGDAVFADDIALDLETRTTVLSTLRVDYSQAVPAGKPEYEFELRRPDDEQIAAMIPIPDAFDVTPIGDVAFQDSAIDLTWTPVIEGSTIDIGIQPLDDDCLIVVGSDVGDVAKQLDDTGTYRLDTDIYHSLDHDCAYDLVFTR